MANRVFKAFQETNAIEFRLDGIFKPNFAKKIFSKKEKIIAAIKNKTLLRLIIFYFKCNFRIKLKPGESELSSDIYLALISSELNKNYNDHEFELFDKERNIRLRAFFQEKDAFLSVFRILDEYAKAIIINQYNLSKENIADRIIVDGGSNMGEFAIYCCRLGAKKVYSFEPLSSTFEILKNQIKINKLEDRIIAVNKALGDKNENVNISFLGDGDAAAAIKNGVPEGKFETVSAIRLDDFLKNEPVGFIKLDVEGYEENVLNGAREIISKNKPTLAIAAYHKQTDLKILPETIKSIRSDYNITLLNKAEHDLYCD